MSVLARTPHFHRSWKSHTRVEHHGLIDQSAIERWSIIKASHAMEIERIKHLSRQQPDAPASDHLSASVIRAIVALRHGYDVLPEPDLPLSTVVLWLAQLGGYTTLRSSGGYPPGSKVLMRGWLRVEPLAGLFEAGYDIVPRRSGQ